MSEEKNPIAMDSNPSNWPSDVVREIAKRLGSRRYIFHMRAVCSDWRSSIPIPPKTGFPLKLPFPIYPRTRYYYRELRGHYLLKYSTIFCVEPLKEEPTECWIARIEETDSGKVRVRDILSGSKTCEKLENEVINLLDYRVREIGRAYSLELAPKDERWSCSGSVDGLRKVVAGHDDEGQFWVMVLHSFNGFSGRLGVWKMGFDKWQSIGDSYFDIAYHNGKVYACKRSGYTVAFDPLSLDVTEVGEDIDCHDRGLYLVSSLGNLFAFQFSGKKPDSESSENDASKEPDSERRESDASKESDSESSENDASKEPDSESRESDASKESDSERSESGAGNEPDSECSESDSESSESDAGSEPDSESGECDADDDSDYCSDHYFEVYKLDEKRCSWKKSDDLKNHVTFIRDYSSYTISTADFAAFKGKMDCIFFRDNYLERSNFPDRLPRRAAFYDLQALCW